MNQTDPSINVEALAVAEIGRLKDETIQNLGIVESELAATLPGQMVLRFIELFIKGVRIQTALILSPDRDLHSLIEMKSGFLPMPIYMAVTNTINDIASKHANSATPVEFRGFMASYSLFAWMAVTEAGIAFEPGKTNMPHAFFERLEVGSPETPRPVDARALEPQVPALVRLLRITDQILIGASFQAQAMIGLVEIEQRSPDLAAKLKAGSQSFVEAVARLIGQVLHEATERELQALGNNPKRDLLIPIYGGVVKTSRDLVHNVESLPYEMKLLLAAYVQIVWDEVQAHEIDFELENPQAVAVDLGVPDDPRITQSRIPPTPVAEPPQPRISPETTIEEVVADLSDAAARHSGMPRPPTQAVVQILALADSLQAAALLSNQAMFGTLLGPLAKLRKHQRRAFGFTTFNKYPFGAVSYVKALLIEAGRTGLLAGPLEPVVASIEDGYA